MFTCVYLVLSSFCLCKTLLVKLPLSSLFFSVLFPSHDSWAYPNSVKSFSDLSLCLPLNKTSLSNIDAPSTNQLYLHCLRLKVCTSKNGPKFFFTWDLLCTRLALNSEICLPLSPGIRRMYAFQPDHTDLEGLWIWFLATVAMFWIKVPLQIPNMVKAHSVPNCEKYMFII